MAPEILASGMLVRFVAKLVAIWIRLQIISRKCQRDHNICQLLVLLFHLVNHPRGTSTALFSIAAWLEMRSRHVDI